MSCTRRTGKPKLIYQSRLTITFGLCSMRSLAMPGKQRGQGALGGPGSPGTAP